MESRGHPAQRPSPVHSPRSNASVGCGTSVLRSPARIRQRTTGWHSGSSSGELRPSLLSDGALHDAAALEATLEGVHLELAPVVLRPGASFMSTAEWLMRRWMDTGTADEAALGGFGADPVGTLAATGQLPQGSDRALADAAGLATMTAARYPGVRALSIDATVYAEAGASEGTELAAALATGAAYLRAMSDAGLEADAAGGQIEIVLGADPDFFTTIAKLRTFRRVWSSMVEACGVDPAAAPPELSVRTLQPFHESPGSMGEPSPGDLGRSGCGSRRSGLDHDAGVRFCAGGVGRTRPSNGSEHPVVAGRGVRRGTSDRSRRWLVVRGDAHRRSWPKSPGASSARWRAPAECPGC